ncbi:MAG: MFS transporter [Actinomycetota bacterium]
MDPLQLRQPRRRGAGRVGPPPARDGRTASLTAPASSLAVPGYRLLWCTGWLWHIARWMTMFATTFRVNEQTGDPLLVQLVGTAFMAPMFLGGPLIGMLTDRIDPGHTVRGALVLLVPLSAMMGLAVAGDRAPVLVSYAFVFCVGIGNVVDMTSRRTLAFGLVGSSLVTNAAALESLGLHAGNMVGSLVGGAVIEASGVSTVYLGIGLLYAVALVTLSGSVRQARSAAAGAAGDAAPPPAASSAAPTSALQDLQAGFGLLRTHPLLRQFLVTTVLMNFFFYAFTPLIPVFAEDLGVGPFLTGLLASAVGMGVMTGALIVARLQPTGRGLIHVAGSIGAMTMLVVFANVGWYPAAFAALYLAGLFGAGFGTTQSALVVSLVDERLRGRALGVLSMAIGALPFGMFTLGLLARSTAPRPALTISVVTGIVLLLLWHARRPELRALA